MNDHSVITKAVTEAVDKAVNGKIINMSKKLDDYIAMDTRWKEENQEALDNVKSATKLGTLLVRVILMLGSVAAATIEIKNLVQRK